MSKKLKILVCTGKKCRRRGGEKVLEAIEEASNQQGSPRIVKECKCLGLCKTGPSIVVSPEKFSYGGVTPKDGAEIVQHHSQKDAGELEQFAVKSKKRKRK